MASMTVEFYKVELKNEARKKDEDYLKIKNIIQEIMVNCHEHDAYKSIDLSPGVSPNSIEPKEIMDIFEDDKYLFGRICRKKKNNAILKRDYSTLEAEEVFTDSESRSRGIEVFTFFIYDYIKGILSIVNSKGAPGTKSIKLLMDIYKPEYSLGFVNIPNEEGIRVLYNSGHPEISKLEFELPSPDAEFLQSVLGLDEEIIRDMIQEDVFTASISLKPVPYGKLLKSTEKVRDVLDILINKKAKYSKTKVRGRSEQFNSRDFDLNAKMFTYPIDVVTYRIVNGRKVEYSLQEVVDQFRSGLKKAYENNYDLITGIANR